MSSWVVGCVAIGLLLLADDGDLLRVASGADLQEGALKEAVHDVIRQPGRVIDYGLVPVGALDVKGWGTGRGDPVRHLQVRALAVIGHPGRAERGVARHL